MPEVNGSDVRTVVIACDAGMGSSVMVATQLRQRLKKYDVAVEHVPVNSIPADATVVVCHAGLAQRARGMAPGAVVVPFQLFMGDPAFDRVEAAIRDGGVLAD
ncbi:MAG TPA: PTS lactose transporter subunit IIB [Candidatus Limnocylindria bacterium]